MYVSFSDCCVCVVHVCGACMARAICQVSSFLYQFPPLTALRQGHSLNQKLIVLDRQASQQPLRSYLSLPVSVGV